MLSACQQSESFAKHLQTTLPPSFDSHAPGHRSSAKIEYILKARVERPGRFRPNISTQQELSFYSLNPPLSSIPSGPGYNTTTSGALYHPAQQKTASTLDSTGQTPILLLEARVPSPAVLFAGDKIPLLLLLRKLLTREDNLCPIRLQSIAISIQSTTTVTIGSDRTSWTASRNLLQLKDLGRAVTNLQEKDVLSEPNSGMPQDLTLPDITPSFTTCTVRHEHSLEVTCGFSLGNDTTSKVCSIFFRWGISILMPLNLASQTRHQRRDTFQC